MDTDGGGTAPRSGPRPVDVVLGVYALASAPALLFPHRPRGAPLLLAVHLLFALSVLRLLPAGRLAGGLFRLGREGHRIHRRGAGPARFLREWYPLLLIPLLYREIEVLNQAVWGERLFDGWVMALEERVFGLQASRDLGRALPFTALSELLHASYLSYYFIIYLPPLYLYLRGQAEAFRITVFGVMLTFLFHYLVFDYFPVAGPYFIPDSWSAGWARGPLQAFTHHLLSSGASQGATFPSSHVAVAVAQATLAARLAPRAFPLLALGALGIAVSTVYGGIHYGVDSVAGALAGWVLARLALRVSGVGGAARGRSG